MSTNFWYDLAVMPHQPIGLVLTRTSRAVSRAFDQRLSEAGGSLPIWLILLALKTRPTRSQSELAEVVGIRGATLSHHLDGMESAGLVTRRRDPASRRTSLVELTEAGTQLFLRLREAAVAHDRQLRTGLSEQDVTRLAALLDRLAANVSAPT
jgi:MarR family transcriptional regulator, transcriptional regulator for hemolysin